VASVVVVMQQLKVLRLAQMELSQLAVVVAVVMVDQHNMELVMVVLV